MYEKAIVSPLDLVLDPQNPRFIVPNTGDSQSNIRHYLLTQEDALSLAKGVVENNGLMPGERIVVCVENGKYVVLEGNRRTCVCQLFLNRNLIPNECIDGYPSTTDILKANIEQVEVDIINSREEARRFLAIRHIERAREWKPIAKMRFCFEDYSAGKTVKQINERTGIAVSSINKHIKMYKILVRGLDASWSAEEKQKLNILNIEPSKLLRIFELSDTNKILKLYFDSSFVLRSNEISDDDIDEIIRRWTAKAFIEDAMNTRTEFYTYTKDGAEVIGAAEFVKDILCKYEKKEVEPTVDSALANQQTATTSTTLDAATDSTNPTSNRVNLEGTDTDSQNPPTSEPTNKTQNGTSAAKPEGVTPTPPATGGGPKNLPFFSALNWSGVNPAISANNGIISVCNEVKRISDSTTFVNYYPVCTAFIIRALIEQSIKYHARSKGIWLEITRAYNAPGAPGGDPTLSFIIKQYTSNLRTWIPDHGVRRLFNVVFNFKSQTEKLNMVVHSPESYLLTPDTLKSIPNEGLLELVNYLLK